MSLINQMLQDLDARSSHGIAGSATNVQVRAVGKRRRRYAVWVLAFLLVGLALGLGAWLFMHQRQVAKSVAAVGPVAQLQLKPNLDLAIVPIPPPPQPVPPISPQSTPPDEVTSKSIEASLPKNPPSLAIEKDKPIASAPASAPLPPAPVHSALPDLAVESQPVKPLPSKAPAVQKPGTPAQTDGGPTAKAETPTTLTKRVEELTPALRAETEFRKASSLMQQGKGTEAIVLLEQTLQIDPQHAAARQTLVALLLEAKRQDEAVRRLQDGLKLDPGQPGSAMILARLQVERGEQTAAIATLDRTLPYGVDRADYQSFLGALLQREGRHKEAVEHYLVAVRKAPQNGVWWMGLGISLQADGKVAAAKDAFTRARTTNSLTPELQAFVDQKLDQLGR